MAVNDLQHFLNNKVDEYNQPFFIAPDPISIPHGFSDRADIEIAGFFAAVFAWGIRATIINKSLELMNRMDDAPYEFITQHEEKDLKAVLDFKHRTFNDTDLLYFISFLRFHYKKEQSLESAFSKFLHPQDLTIEKALIGFNQYFFSLEDVPTRTRKHIANPLNGSTCKRLNMFLRWMVRSDDRGVDFGLWKTISPAQLICPIDLHVARVAQRFNLLQRPWIDWAAAIELTDSLRQMDPDDPVKYDFALFGLGVMEKF